MRCVRSVRSWMLLASLVLVAAPAAAQTFTDATEISGADVGPQTSFGNPVWVDFDADAGPSLLKNLGHGNFAKVRAASGISPTGDRHRATWGDYNNDGLTDRRLPRPIVTAPAGIDWLWRNNGDGTTSWAGPAATSCSANNGNGRFTELAAAAGVVAATGAHGEGAAWGDYDGDGFLDLHVTRSGRDAFGRPEPRTVGTETKICLPLERRQLFRNTDNGHRWLTVELVGTTGPRDGLGASIWVRVGARWQYRYGGGGGEFFCQGAGPAHFGLGAASQVDAVIVRWPSGKTSTLTQLAPEQTVTITEWW